jgi:hypothetical protein
MAHKCGHRSCSCDPEGKEYCSTHCTEAALFEEEQTRCECGHSVCEQRQPQHVP